MSTIIAREVEWTMLMPECSVCHRPIHRTEDLVMVTTWNRLSYPYCVDCIPEPTTRLPYDKTI